MTDAPCRSPLTVALPLWLLLVVPLLAPLPARAQTPIRIGASLSLTGTYAALGPNQQRGYELCAKHVNAKGGLLGRTIEFVFYDDQSQPATGVRLYEKLITQDKVDAVMGPYSSADHRGGGQREREVPDAHGGAAWPPPPPSSRRAGSTSSWSVSPAEVYLEGLIDMAGQARAQDHRASSTRTRSSPRRTVQGTVELAKKRGLQVVFVEAYPKGNTDFSAILTKIKAANPDVLAAATYFDDAVAITRQMRELNVNPKMFGVTVGGDLPKFYELLGRNAEFVYGSTQWEAELPYPGAQEFAEAYSKEFPGADLSYHSAAGYAGCQIVVEAMRRAGSLDGEKLREAISKLDFNTVYGAFKVDPDGFQVAHKMITVPVAGRQEGDRVAGRAGRRQGALPDAAVEPALRPRRGAAPPSGGPRGQAAAFAGRRGPGPASPGAGRHRGPRMGVAVTPTMVGQVVISGLLAGALYAMVALGLALIFGVMRVINVAHGTILMLGAYTTFWCFQLPGPEPLPLAPRLQPADVSLVGASSSGPWCAGWWTPPSCRRSC